MSYMIKIEIKLRVPEVWANCSEFPRVQVSNQGNVKVDGEIRRGNDNGDGYIVMHIPTSPGRKHVQVHRLIAKAFVSGYDEEHNQVDHVNRVRYDNRAINLRWVSALENSNNAEGQKNDGLRGGIYKHKNSYQVQFGHKKYLERGIRKWFPTIEEATTYLEDLRLKYPN